MHLVHMRIHVHTLISESINDLEIHIVHHSNAHTHKYSHALTSNVCTYCVKGTSTAFNRKGCFVMFFDFQIHLSLGDSTDFTDEMEGL